MGALSIHDGERSAVAVQISAHKEHFAHLMHKELHCEQIHAIMLHFDLENELDIQKQVKGDRDHPKGMIYGSCMYQPYML